MDSCRASLYTSFYRSILSTPSRMEDFGSLVSAILMAESGFSGIVQGFRDLTERILTKPPLQRKGVEVSFIRGLLRQKNALIDKVCKDWPQFQVLELCQKIGFRRVVGLDRIIEYDTFGTCAYLILRGCARVFAMQTDERELSGAGLYKFVPNVFDALTMFRHWQKAISIRRRPHVWRRTSICTAE